MENQGVIIDQFAISTLISSKNVAKTELIDTYDGSAFVQPLCFCNGNGEELTFLKGKNVLIIDNIKAIILEFDMSRFSWFTTKRMYFIF